MERLRDRCRVAVGDARLILRSPLPGTPGGDRFSEFRIGVDHVAFAVSDREELDALIGRLRQAGVETRGIQTFTDPDEPADTKEFVCFRDPDNVQVEFYMR